MNQIMVKGKGVFVNVASKNTKSKLRVLYEVAPIGFIIEKAGGKTSEGFASCAYVIVSTTVLVIETKWMCIRLNAGEKSVLDIPILNTEQVSQAAFGSAGEVERFEQVVGRKYI